MAGRKSIPTRLKVLTGNPGKRPLNENEPKPDPAMPPMPDWLTVFPIAVAEWEREGGILHGMGILTTAEAGTFAMRCYLAAQIQEAAESIRESEEKNYSQIKNLITEYRQLGSLLGLDPASRAKLSVDKPKHSKFDGLISSEASKRQKASR